MQLPKSAGLAIFASFLAVTASFGTERRPNQIFVLVDDFGRDWVGAYGAANATPNIDRLAAEGMRFTTVWATPVCTPSRVALLTGQYPYRSGWISHYDVPRWGGIGLDPDRFATLGVVLRRAGYATAVAGKWQINDLRREPGIMNRHGFDEHCLWPGVEEGNEPSVRRYWDAFLQTNGERRIHHGEFGPAVVHGFALDFIRRNRDRPFFLYYSMINVHAPNEPTPLNRSNPPKGEAALYAGMVEYTDRQIGELLQVLEELGLKDNTIIYFTGDNGSSTGGTLEGRNVPARKARVSDLGVHVPLLVHAPGLVPAGVVSETLTDFTDILPTLAQFAGASLPPGSIDGHSLADVLTGKRSAGARQWIFTQYGVHRAVRDTRFFFDNQGVFSDLAADPLQEKNLAAGELSAEFASARDRLQNVLRSLPSDGPIPFPGYERAEQLLRDHLRDEKQSREGVAK